MKLLEELLSALNHSDTASVCIHLAQEETQCDYCAVYPVRLVVHTCLAPEDIYYLHCVTICVCVCVCAPICFLFCLYDCVYSASESTRKDSGEAVIFILISTRSH